MTTTEVRETTAAWPSGATGVLWSIVRLAAPLTLFFAIQSGVNLAGVAMLGRVGDAALAGVGAASAIYSVVLALMFGADAAVQATVSRRVGAGRSDRLGQVLADTLALTLPLGAVLAAGIWIAAPLILDAMLRDKGAASAGVAYLRAASPSLFFFALTIPINACWIGSGRPQLALLVTAVLAPIQIAAAFLFIFGGGAFAAQGAAGAGAAITFVGLIGVFFQLALASRRAGVSGFPHMPPRADGARAIAAIGWPISLQQAFLQLGLMAAYVILGRLGVAQVAAANVLISLATVAAQLAGALGIAAGVLVGQALGRRDIAEARRWGWRTVGVGIAVMAPFAVLAVLFTRPLLGLFLRDPATLEIAVWPTRVVGLSIAADTLGRILCFAIRGAGATRIGAAVPFVSQWLVQLPLTWWMAVALGFGLLGMAGVQCGVAVAEALVTAVIWAGPGWTAHKAFARGA